MRVKLSVICSSIYKESIAYKFFDQIKELFRNEGSVSLMETKYLKDKYLSSIKALIAKYDNITEVDKLAMATQKSELIINMGKKTLEKLLDKGKEIEAS